MLYIMKLEYLLTYSFKLQNFIQSFYNFILKVLSLKWQLIIKYKVKKYIYFIFIIVLIN